MNFEDELNEKSIQTPTQEREISLGTGTILGIFFVLAIICAAFFGFGYTMGRHAAQAAAATIPETNTVAKTDAKADSAFSNFKAAPVASSSPGTAASALPATDTPPQGAPDGTDAAKAPVTNPAANTPAADAPAAADPGTVVEPPVASDGSWMVQVSATTRKPDAEALTRVLVDKGFTATIKQDADQKFHVRVGPFASKKDADTTRKLLVASGYKDPFLTPR